RPQPGRPWRKYRVRPAKWRGSESGDPDGSSADPPARNHRQTTARYRQSRAYEPARGTGDPVPDRTWSNRGAPDRFVFSWFGPLGSDQQGWNAVPVLDWGRSV